jgi:hypothetical protein
MFKKNGFQKLKLLCGTSDYFRIMSRISMSKILMQFEAEEPPKDKDSTEATKGESLQSRHVKT